MLTYAQLANTIVGASIEVHRELGSGLLESVYEECLLEELRLRGLKCSTQVDVPIHYKGRMLSRRLRLDVLVEERVVLEIKTVDFVNDAHIAQLISYLKLSGCKLGYVLNFNDALMKTGVHRRVNNLNEP